MQENLLSEFPTKSHTNRLVHPKKKAEELEISYLNKEEGLYYLCSEKDCTDQLCTYCTSDLRLYFCIGENPFFIAPAYWWRQILLQKSTMLRVTKMHPFRNLLSFCALYVDHQ